MMEGIVDWLVTMEVQYRAVSMFLIGVVAIVSFRCGLKYGYLKGCYEHLARTQTAETEAEIARMDRDKAVENVLVDLDKVESALDGLVEDGGDE